jgi:hypothetical protein
MLGPVAFAQFLSPIIGVLAAAMLATRRRVVRRFEQAAAFDAATSIDPLQSRFFGVVWWRRRLTGLGVVRTTPDGREWLDLKEWARYRQIRRKRALLLGGSGLLALAILWFVLRP